MKKIVTVMLISLLLIVLVSCDHEVLDSNVPYVAKITVINSTKNGVDEGVYYIKSAEDHDDSGDRMYKTYSNQECTTETGFSFSFIVYQGSANIKMTCSGDLGTEVFISDGITANYADGKVSIEAGSSITKAFSDQFGTATINIYVAKDTEFAASK